MLLITSLIAMFRDQVMDFPEGTIITKTFAFDTAAGEEVVETRLLIRRATGWTGFLIVPARW